MFSLYIHIPFCIKKCPYCGFYSTPYDISAADAYITVVSKEASNFSQDFIFPLVDTVYIGGGTPSVLSERQFSLLTTDLFGKFQIQHDAEITIEANPNTVTEHKLETWLDHRVNRLSLGVQSFSDNVLRTLGRFHNAEQAYEAFALARQTGFKNIGMDLIYGVPNQTPGEWEDSVKTALDCMPAHLSLYGLSFDDGSLFRKESDAGRMHPSDDESAASMYEQAVAMLARAGYQRYEISNFALPGRECRHNLNYWDRGEYLGLGAGAWSFLKGRRSRTVPDCSEYQRRVFGGMSTVVEEDVPDADQAARETIMLSLRTANGLDLKRFADNYGESARARLEQIGRRLVAEGVVLLLDGRLILTDRGMLLSNEALTRLTV
jgi:oxygen-independent coproporphyrinogen III oxidase